MYNRNNPFNGGGCSSEHRSASSEPHSGFIQVASNCRPHAPMGLDAGVA